MNYDALVIGNGCLGLSVAWHLAQRSSVSIAVAGPPARRGGATTAAGAMLGCFGEVTRAMLGSSQGRKKLELDIEATRAWPGWVDELRASSGMHDAVFSADGTTVILNTVGLPAIDSANFEAIRQAAAEYGAPHEDVAAEDVSWLQPDPLARPLRALHLPGERAVDAAAYIALLDRAVETSGVAVVPDTVRRITPRQGGFVCELASTEIACGVVIVAAGAESWRLLSTAPGAADGVPPMVSGYGVSALVEVPTGDVPNHVIRTPNRAFACGLHLVPRRHGVVYLGATNIVSERIEELARPADLTFLLDCAMRQLNLSLAHGGLRKVQVGNRPIAVDGYPLLGLSGLDDLWLLTGTYRDGLHLSPVLGAEMAESVLTGAPSERFKDFAPVRPPIVAAAREDIVAATVENMLATGYESAWRVPVDWDARIRKHFTTRYERRAEAVDPEFTLPPELLASASAELLASIRDYCAYHRARV